MSDNHITALTIPSDAQLERDRTGKRHFCCACGHPGTYDNPLVLDNMEPAGFRIHLAELTNPDTGCYHPRGSQLAGDVDAIRAAFEDEECSDCGAGFARHDLVLDVLGHVHAVCQIGAAQ